MPRTQSPETAPHVWVRYSDVAGAAASARRLAAKHGPRFAVVFDDMGINGFISPYAVVSHPSAPSVVLGR